MANIVVIGKSGQVASALQAVYPTAKFLARDSLDLTNPDFTKLGKPEIVINAAAYTGVDKAETEQELCNQINHLAVAALAKYCAENNITLVHYSTDYVFDGTGNQPFTEENTANLQPINTYGKSKLAAEKAIAQSECKYYILRTSWVYSHTGNNFVKTMLRLADKPELKVVNDQIGCPTYAPDIAANTKKLIDANLPIGIYHFTGEEQISWFDFAKMIIPQTNIISIPSSEYPLPAKRPLNSRLSVAKIKGLGVNFPSIRDSLQECLEKIRLGS